MSKIDSNTIHYEGTVLGYATPMEDGTTRLVLKEEARQFHMLRRLIQKHGGLVIDVDKPPEWVKEQVMNMARTPARERLRPHVEPETTQRLFVRGDTHPVRHKLKELGLRWDPQERAWWTYDRKKYEIACRIVARGW